MTNRRHRVAATGDEYLQLRFIRTRPRRVNAVWHLLQIRSRSRKSKRPNATLAASSGFDQPSMIALASSRIPELGARLWKSCRLTARNTEILTPDRLDQWNGLLATID